MKKNGPNPVVHLPELSRLRERVIDLERQLHDAQRIAEQLRADKSFLGSLAEMLPLALSVIDAGGRHIADNAAFRAIFAPPPADWSVFADAFLTRIGFAEVMRRHLAGDPDAPPSFVLHYDPARDGPATVLAYPGRPLWLRCHFRRLPAERTGALPHVAVTFEDIAAQKNAEAEQGRAEERLRENEAAFRAMINATRDMAFLMDDRGTILVANDKLAAVFHRTADELVGCNLLEIAAHFQSTKTRWEQAQRVIATGEPVHFEDQQFPEVYRFHSIYPVFDGDRRVVKLAVFSHDVTAEKLARREQEKYEKSLQQMQRLEALGTLAGGIAHDFNTVLSIIKGFAEMTRDKLPPGEALAGNQEQILIAVHRAKRLIHQILAFSRQLDNERRPVQVHRLVAEALNMLMSYLPRAVRVVRRLDAGAGFVRADPTEIQQIVFNLCTNAIHAMEAAGGELTVTVEPFTVTATTLAGEGTPLAPGRYCHLAVRDTGAGMDERTRARLFEPFFTTKPVGKGTGMGLPVVHGLVRSYDGQIAVESEVGRGSTFHIYLPTVDETAAVEDEPATALPRGDERILLVDDEPQVLTVCRLTLEELGYQVSPFTSSLRALNGFLKKIDQFDLLITDQVMPRLTGLVLIERVRECRPDLPVIVTSAYAKRKILDALARLPRVRFLAKPFGKSELATAVREILDERKTTNAVHPGD
jgi:PAS domain S-box-containing protein